MFRRRPFVRPLRGALRPDVHPMLRRANELMAAGEYEKAAEAYEQLARGAQQRGGQRDAQLFLQAGRCRIKAGQTPAGVANLKQGLTLISKRGNLQHLQNAGQRTLALLNRQGLTAEAAEIEAFLKDNLPEGTPIPVEIKAATKTRLLPTACPACGGPLRSDEVEWVDEATAECPFCGGAVRAE